MALIRDTHTVSFSMARVRGGGIPCGSCKMLESSHKPHAVKKAAIEASSRVSQAGHKQVLLEISDVPRILTPWRAMQPCNMPSRRWRREEINAATKHWETVRVGIKRGATLYVQVFTTQIKDYRVREDVL